MLEKQGVKVCEKCGYQMKDSDLVCPNCGEIVNKNDVNAPILKQVPLKKAQLKKCAWFAPASVVLSMIIYVVAHTFANNLISEKFYNSEQHYYSSPEYEIITALLYVLKAFVPLIVAVVFFSIAVSGVEQKSKKKAFATLLSPLFFALLPIEISSAINIGFSYCIGLAERATISGISTAVLTILGAVASYFLVAISFKEIDLD